MPKFTYTSENELINALIPMEMRNVWKPNIKGKWMNYKHHIWWTVFNDEDKSNEEYWLKETGMFEKVKIVQEMLQGSYNGVSPKMRCENDGWYVKHVLKGCHKDVPELKLTDEMVKDALYETFRIVKEKVLYDSFSKRRCYKYMYEEWCKGKKRRLN